MNVNCPECRDGEVFPPVDGTDPHGRYASAPCPACSGSGLNPVALEAAAKAHYLAEPDHNEWGWKRMGDWTKARRIERMAAAVRAFLNETGEPT